MRAMRGLWLGVCVALLPVTGSAQDTLADIRQDLAVLSAELQRLQRELSTTGSPSITLPSTAIDRINTIESELQRLTGLSEQLQFRIESVVTDGTNRLGDLEFRICELEPGCDLGTLATSQPLGAGAVDQLATFRETYPGSPLEPQVLLIQGQALEGLGDTREAARAYLALYSGYPNSPAAPLALTRLGVSLGALGKVAEACVTLAEVAARYPATDAVPQAQDAMTGLGCS